ncbi:MAG: phosphoglycerate dehydrogenase [SAR324 cluster bacterium]|nr:phosphoglycerate dehydrogenase [SAR324 cluster bacterium]
MAQVFISTFPFGKYDRAALTLLEEAGVDFAANPFDRKLTPEELCDLALDAEVLIASTEDLTSLITKSTKLKAIVRVGIGLDSVPLNLCKEKSIQVAYTPDAVTEGVGEVTVASMISLSRKLNEADRQMRRGEWNRLTGLRLGKSKVGIIGFGRVGTLVYRLMQPFGSGGIYINDITETAKDNYQSFLTSCPSQWATKEEIYKECDIITVHTPLNDKTKDLITKKELAMMKPNALLINYARGGIINEADLYDALKSGQIAGAAIDCFEKEPYKGPLTELDNILLTQHMGSCAFDIRFEMETQSAKEAIRFVKGEAFVCPVPAEEYEFSKD